MPKISALTAGSALVGTEVVPVVQGGATVKSTIDEIATRAIAYDAELAAIAGLVSAADRGIYFTGSGTASLFTFTAAGRALLDDADATAQRATLGLVIGTNVQAYDAQLADIAGITFAQGDVIYFNGTNLVNLGPGTSGQFLKTQGAAANPVWAAVTGATVGDADYGDITVSGGVWTIDAGVVTYAKIASAAIATTTQYRANTADRLIETDTAWGAADYVALTPGTNVSVDMSSGFNFSLAMGGNYTLDNPTNTKSQAGAIVITQDGTGSRTLAYGTNWKFAGGTDPTLSTAAGAVDVLFYQVISSTSIVGNLVKAIA